MPAASADDGGHVDDETEKSEDGAHAEPRIARCPSAESRACVIVLDAVGAGELPDAADYGDEGSNTLANVAKAVGGLDLPNLEALGLGNVEPLEGCPPQPGAPAVAGRLLERSKGKDTTTGHWEMMGIVTAQAFPTLPARLPARRDRPVHAPHRRAACSATSPHRARRSSRSSARSTRRPASGSSTRRPTRSSRSPRTRRRSRSTSCTRRARVAREILTGKHAVGRVIARPFTGEPGNYVRTPNRHDFSLEPRRPNYLSLMRDAGTTVHGVGKIGDIFAGCDIDESHPTKSNIDGIQQTEKLLQELDEGFVFVNLVETDSLWGHRNDPVNFHRCLQDFDRRLPDLLEALRPGDLLIITSDHGCDPTTPSTDHSREHALLLAYVAGPQRRRADPRGRVRGRRRDRERVAEGQGAVARHPGTADPRAVAVRRRRAHRAQARRGGAAGRGARRARARLRARRGSRLPARGVLHGRLLPGALERGDVRADRCDGAERRDDRPRAARSAAASSTSTRPAASATRRRSRSGRSSPRAACRSGR